jgi:2-dehydro-3-deoxyphosphogluconate aldolase/(4S)-4-hydroxy-2-oxoglutarate aldolase
LKDDFISQFEAAKIVPVAVIENESHAVPLGRALLAASLPKIEITFRTEAAAPSIRALRQAVPEMMVGAGTILTTDQVSEAVQAGAHFMVTPGFNPRVVDYCVESDIPIIPGVSAPSFVEWGLERGLTLFKFFPAEYAGGPDALALMQGPYPAARFMPTGGIDDATIMAYLRLDNVIACGGSWIVKQSLISTGQFDTITELIKTALALIRSEVG